MKYIVEVKYTNPSHEHVSLRRRVDTITRVVEARNEQEAMNRAANQQRSLGFKIEAATVVQNKVEEPKVAVISEDADKREAGYKMSPAVRAAQKKSDELSKREKRPQAGTLAAAKKSGKVVRQKTDADVKVNVTEEIVSEKVVNKKVVRDVATPGQQKKVKAAKIAIGAARNKINLKPMV